MPRRADPGGPGVLPRLCARLAAAFPQTGKSSLFTIGFLQLNFFWKGAAGILLWPVYLGSALRPLLQSLSKL